MDNLDLFINVIEMISGLVEARKIYAAFVDIVHDKTYSKEARYEASELTKDGFHSFIGKVNKMSGGDSNR